MQRHSTSRSSKLFNKIFAEHDHHTTACLQWELPRDITLVTGAVILGVQDFKFRSGKSKWIRGTYRYDRSNYTGSESWFLSCTPDSFSGVICHFTQYRNSCVRVPVPGTNGLWSVVLQYIRVPVVDSTSTGYRYIQLLHIAAFRYMVDGCMCV